MCTVSWLHCEGGYQVFCNRDEKNTRLAALPPAVREIDGVTVIAPMDGDHAGTWIAVNEFGLTLALLNRGGAPAGARSRGLLVSDLTSSPAANILAERIFCTDLSAYAGFTLVAIEAAAPIQLLEWDGHNLSHVADAGHCLPVTSSSVDQVGAERRRKAEFEARVQRARGPNEDMLLEFHRSHGPANATPSAYSTCMHRSDASTVGFSRVTVRQSEIEMFYSPGPPCERGTGKSVCMSRTAEAVSV